MKGPRNASASKQSAADPFSVGVKLLPDKSTDRLRQLANQHLYPGTRGSIDNVPVRDKKATNNRVVRMDIYQDNESSNSRSQSKLASGFMRSERS